LLHAYYAATDTTPPPELPVQQSHGRRIDPNSRQRG